MSVPLHAVAHRHLVLSVTRAVHRETQCNDAVASQIVSARNGVVVVTRFRICLTRTVPLHTVAHRGQGIPVRDRYRYRMHRHRGRSLAVVGAAHHRVCGFAAYRGCGVCVVMRNLFISYRPHIRCSTAGRQRSCMSYIYIGVTRHAHCRTVVHRQPQRHYAVAAEMVAPSDGVFIVASY